MGMHEVYNILVSLGGTATTAQMHVKAKEIGYDKYGLCGGLRSLERWHVVATKGPKYCKLRELTWSLTGDKIDWNVVTE